MNLLSIILLSAAALLVVILTVYAGYLWRKVWKQQAQQAALEHARHRRLNEDLKILAGSLLDEQLPLIEGAIRIKVLLDNYSMALSHSPHCLVFHELYGATAHIPTHNGWRALSKAERRAHEQQFQELELQHKGEARRAAQWLIDEGLRAGFGN